MWAVGLENCLKKSLCHTTHQYKEKAANIVFILLVVLCSMVYDELSCTLSYLETALRSR